MLATAIGAPLIGAMAVLLVAGVVVVLRIGTEKAAYLAVGLMLLVIMWNGFRVGGSAAADAFLGLAFLAVALHVAVTRARVPFPPWLFAAAVGFLFAGLLNMVFPPRNSIIFPSYFTYATSAFQLGYAQAIPQRSDISALMKFETSLILMPLVIAAVATSYERIQRLLDVFALSALISAFVALVDYGGIHIAPTAIQGTRSSGLTFHPNYLALSSAIAIPLVLRWVGRSRRWDIAGLGGTLLLIAAVYASGSRAGIVGAVLALAVTVAALPRLRRLTGVAVPIIGMALVIVLGTTRFGHKVLEQVRLAHGSQTSGSDSSRSQAATLAWRQFRARPVSGVGFSVIADAHDIYLELAAAGGLLTLGAFGVYLGGLFKSLRRALDSPESDTAIVAGIAVLVWLANGIFDNQLADKYLYVVPGLLMSLGLVSARARRRAPAATLAGERGLELPAGTRAPAPHAA